MNQALIMESILEAFSNLAELNSMLYDYWISELYIGNEMIDSMWNEHTLKLMENDVMMQRIATEVI